MKTVTVSWQPDRERFVAQGTHQDRTIVINAPRLDPATPATGFSPSELLLAGAGACSAWDVVGILRKQRQAVTGIEVRVRGSQEPEPPWTFRAVELHYAVRGRELDRRRVEEAIRLSEERYCSVVATLRGAAEVTFTSEILDEPEGAEGPEGESPEGAKGTSGQGGVTAEPA